MKTIYKVLNLFFLINFIFVVSSAKAQTINIKGELVDSISKTKLPYGTLSLKNKQDSVVRNVLTNEHGEFLFENISFSDGMYLTTSYLGYNKKTIFFNLNKKLKIDIGKILLVPKIISLSEYVVKGQEKYVVKKIDRKVYKMNRGKIAAARTVSDLLRVLPGVVVDNEGNVRYKGAEAIIYVDEQPLNFQFPNIEMIPVDKVDKIELIDVSMRSGGNGKGGIINIKFKRLNTNGLSGMLSARANTISFKNLDKSKEFLNINYKNKDFTFFLNTSIEKNFSNRNSFITKEVNLPFSSSNQNINSLEKSQHQPNFNNVGVIYWPSLYTKLYLSCGFYTLKYSSDFESFFLENDLINQKINNSYIYNESYNSDQLYKGINLSYWHKIDTLDTYVKIFGHFNSYKILSKQNSDYYFSQLNNNTFDSIYSYSNNRYFKSNEISLNIFYNNSISKSTRWNLFYNLSICINDTNANNHSIFEKKYLPQSQFDVKNDQKHNLSWRIGTKLKKWKIDCGINFVDYLIDGNYTRYKINFQDTIIPLKKNYFKILPSTTFAYEINKKKEIKLTLSKSTSLPDFNKLSDYIDKKNLYNWSSGNSDLKPVDFYSVYLGYSYSVDKCNASAEFFYNYTNNEVANVSIPLTSQLTLTKPENFAHKSNIGVDMSTWYKLNNQLNFSLSSTFFYLLYDISTLKNTAIYYNLSFDKLKKTKLGYYVKFNAEYNLKGYYAMFYLNYHAQELTFDGYKKSWINSSFNVSKSFLNKKLRASVGVNNIFNDIIEHGSYSNNFGIITNTKISGSFSKMLCYFLIQYKFKQGDRGTKDLRIGG